VVGEPGPRIDHRRILDVGEDDVISGAPVERVRHDVDALGGAAQQSNVTSRAVDEIGEVLLRRSVNVKHPLATHHAVTLVGGKPGQRRQMTLENWRLPAGAQVGDAADADKLLGREQCLTHR